MRVECRGLWRETNLRQLYCKTNKTPLVKIPLKLPRTYETVENVENEND
jgi:hypothetical protein